MNVSHNLHLPPPLWGLDIYVYIFIQFIVRMPPIEDNMSVMSSGSAGDNSTTLHTGNSGSEGECHLTYFEGRGLANPIRFTLALYGVRWSETFLREPAQIARLRASNKLRFEQVPLVEFNGASFVQSGATIRYIDRYCREQRGDKERANDEQTDVEMWAEGAHDFYVAFVRLPFAGDATERAKYTAETLEAKTLPRYLPIFEKQLLATAGSSGGSGWVAGTPFPCYADATLYCAIEFALEIGTDLGADKYPGLARWKSNFEALDGIGSFLGSKYHFPHPDEAYVAGVRAALA